MSFGSILGQIMQDGLGGQGRNRDRLRTTADNLDRAGGGVGSIFGQIEAALGRAGVDTRGMSQSAGGFADRTRDFMRNEQVGGLSGAQVGGIGALAGALLGGGLGGAARGGAMAVLGTLALGALKRAQAGGAGASEPLPPDEEEIRALASPDSERLALKAMITAAKADGHIDQAEMQKIVGKLGAGDVSPEERQFVLDQMAAPVDLAALAAEARSPAQAAGVYAASLLAIDADSDQERAYLAELAAALRLDAATVAELHRMTGAPQA